jgi:hypothetical protein
LLEIAASPCIFIEIAFQHFDSNSRCSRAGYDGCRLLPVSLKVKFVFFEFKYPFT